MPANKWKMAITVQGTITEAQFAPTASANAFRIASNVDVDDGNPYVGLFYRALRPYGIEFAGTFAPSSVWLRDNRDRVDALHFHWPEFLLGRCPPSLQRVYELRGGGVLQRLLTPHVIWNNVRALRKFVSAAKDIGKRIIWTVHNVTPHESSSRAQVAAFRSIGSDADLLICHDANTRRECIERYQTNGEVVVMRHGNYDGEYPKPQSRVVVRRQLGFDERRPLLCCLGNLRHYKGLDVACDAVARLGGDVQLLIAGHPHRSFDVRRLQDSVDGLPGAKLIRRRLSEQEFSDFSVASDIFLLPYRQLTGSGALLAALTFERGVIASDLPFFREILGGHPEAGTLFRVADAEALAEAIGRYLAIPAERRTAAARALADQYSWDRVIQPVIEVIHDWQETSKIGV